QHSARFVLLALLLQKTTQAHRRSKLERLRALAAGDVNGVAKASLGFGWSLGIEQQLSLDAVYLRLPNAFPASFCGGWAQAFALYHPGEHRSHAFVKGQAPGVAWRTAWTVPGRVSSAAGRTSRYEPFTPTRLPLSASA